MKKLVLISLIFLLTAESCNNKINPDKDLAFLKSTGLNTEDESLFIILPNEACSFCVNNIIDYLEKKQNQTSAIKIIFLESEMATFINKKRLKELETIYATHYVPMNIAILHSVLEKSNSKPELVFIENKKNIFKKHYLNLGDDYESIYAIIDKYQTN